MKNIVNAIMQQESILSLLSESEKLYIFDQLKLPIESNLNNSEIIRLTFFITNNIFSEEQDLISESNVAYKLLKSINIESENDANDFLNAFGFEGIDKTILYYFYLSNIALKAEKNINFLVNLTHCLIDYIYYIGKPAQRIITSARRMRGLVTLAATTSASGSDSSSQATSRAASAAAFWRARSIRRA